MVACKVAAGPRRCSPGVARHRGARLSLVMSGVMTMTLMLGMMITASEMHVVVLHCSTVDITDCHRLPLVVYLWSTSGLVTRIVVPQITIESF